MANFYAVNSINLYVNEVSKDKDNYVKYDLKMLGEFVIDSVFEHEEETDAIHIFKHLSLEKIREYNDLVYKMKEEGDETNKKTFSATLDVFQFMKQNSIRIGFFRQKSSYENVAELISELPLSWWIEHYIQYGIQYVANRTFLTSDEVDRVNKMDSDRRRAYTPSYHHITPISLPRIHEHNDYILYFINNDFNLNRLRKLLIILMKEQMKLYSAEIDDGKSIESDLENNSLLIEHCRTLITLCKDYLNKQMINETIPLRL